MRRMIPSTGSLKAFEAAARHGSFTEAAHELALTQSAVCRQVAGLEAFLGVKLFRRSRRGVLLTEAGAAYHAQVAKRLAEVERDALNLMAHQGRGGTLELAVVPTFGTRWLLPRLPDFFRQHPNISLNLSSRTRPFLFEETELDAAIYTGNGNWPGTVATYLMPEVLLPVCSPALLGQRSTLAVQELAELPLLQQSTRPYAWRQWFESAGLAPALVPGHALAGTRYELYGMSLEAAAVGLGVALVPEHLLGADLRTGRLVPASAHRSPSDRAYYLVSPASKAEGQAFGAFRQWLCTQATHDACATPSAAPHALP